MTDSKLKYKVVVILVGLLSLAMSLQTLVLVSMGLGTAISHDVDNAVGYSVMIAGLVDIAEPEKLKPSSNISHFYNDPGVWQDSYCVELKLVSSRIGQCESFEEVSSLTKTVYENKKPEIQYTNVGWYLFSFRKETALIVVPIINEAGEVVGSLGYNHSLLPVYQAHEQQAKMAFVYLLFNVIIFATAGFFRMAKLIFKPIDKLVELAENYQPVDEPSFLLNDNLGVFRSLTTSLNSMLAKIEEDNRALRLSVLELERLNDELLENQSLVIRSEKLASVGRLSAGLAHEIGNPLAIIQGYVDLLSRTDFSEDERAQFAEKANSELDRLKKLIRKLLDFSHPSETAMELLHIHQLLDQEIEFVLLEKGFKGCNIITRYNAARDAVYSDPNGLRQIFINCCLNGLDAMEDLVEADKELSITTFNSINTNGIKELTIGIADTGPGIDEQKMSNLFDPFYTTKEPGKGTGLGLFVSHSIVENLGGRIEIKNEINGGAKAEISLPLAAQKLTQNNYQHQEKQ